MENFTTQNQWDEKREEIQVEIWRLCNDVKVELRAEIKKLDMDMLDRFDKLIERWQEFEEKIDKKHSIRFNSLEKNVNTLKKDVNILKKNVVLILSIVSKNGGKHQK